MRKYEVIYALSTGTKSMTLDDLERPKRYVRL